MGGEGERQSVVQTPCRHHGKTTAVRRCGCNHAQSAQRPKRHQGNGHAEKAPEAVAAGLLCLTPLGIKERDTMRPHAEKPPPAGAQRLSASGEGHGTQPLRAHPEPAVLNASRHQGEGHPDRPSPKENSHLPFPVSCTCSAPPPVSPNRWCMAHGTPRSAIHFSVIMHLSTIHLPPTPRVFVPIPLSKRTADQTPGDP